MNLALKDLPEPILHIIRQKAKDSNLTVRDYMIQRLAKLYGIKLAPTPAYKVCPTCGHKSKTYAAGSEDE